MAALVEELSNEHEMLKEQVSRIKQIGVMTPEGFAAMLHLKDLLQAHVSHEDSEMYPLLENAAKNDKTLEMLLERFRHDMQKISLVADEFYSRYTEPQRSTEFGRDVANLFSLLSNRIITEETVLYRHLAKLP